MSTEATEKKEPVVKFLAGNEACVEGALAAGCRFFAGYPISPSSEIAEKMSGRLPKLGGKFIQMEDEIASMGAIIGASLAGAKTMTATSGPGFSLMQENMGYAMMAEVPCVVINVMRGGPSTGNPTGPSQSDVLQSRWGTHGDHPAIVLTPNSIREVFDTTVQCFNFAEKMRTVHGARHGRDRGPHAGEDRSSRRPRKSSSSTASAPSWPREKPTSPTRPTRT